MSTAKTTSGDLPTGLTVDEFLAWAEGRPGRYELLDGNVLMVSPESLGHLRAKGAIYRALQDAIETSGRRCHAVPDGATLRTSRGAFEPDALVYCGEPLDDAMIEVTEPLIVVEVLSPSTQHIDVSIKLAAYFSLPSVAHYIILTPGKKPLVHHQRQSDGKILTSLHVGGTLRLDPPGLDLDVERCFA